MVLQPAVFSTLATSSRLFLYIDRFGQNISEEARPKDRQVLVRVRNSQRSGTIDRVHAVQRPEFWAVDMRASVRVFCTGPFAPICAHSLKIELYPGELLRSRSRETMPVRSTVSALLRY